MFHLNIWILYGPFCKLKTENFCCSGEWPYPGNSWMLMVSVASPMTEVMTRQLNYRQVRGRAQMEQTHEHSGLQQMVF